MKIEEFLFLLFFVFAASRQLSALLTWCEAHDENVSWFTRAIFASIFSGARKSRFGNDMRWRFIMLTDIDSSGKFRISTHAHAQLSPLSWALKIAELRSQKSFMKNVKNSSTSDWRAHTRAGGKFGNLISGKFYFCCQKSFTIIAARSRLPRVMTGREKTLFFRAASRYHVHDGLNFQKKETQTQTTHHHRVVFFHIHHKRWMAVLVDSIGWT